MSRPTLTLDRFEADQAVIIAPDGTPLNLPRALLPEKAREGDQLRLTVGEGPLQRVRGGLRLPDGQTLPVPPALLPPKTRGGPPTLSFSVDADATESARARLAERLTRLAKPTGGDIEL
ncbi:MAG: DUF3006 domain-containing protein [Myxococcales bacterium]|nr:DUF3006 domain-containing protein [Myxococcales bacterium]